MTNKEFLEAVKNGIINEEVQEHAAAEIERIHELSKKYGFLLNTIFECPMLDYSQMR